MKRLFIALSLLILILGGFSLPPCRADSYPLVLVYQTGISGKAAQVRVVLKDATGAVILASTNTPDGTHAFAESGVIPGNYTSSATVTVNPANLPVMGEFTLADGSASGAATIYLANQAAEFVAPFITVPGDHTTTGVSEVLTEKQVRAIEASVAMGDSLPSAPVALGAATVNYYLPGYPRLAAYLVETATITYDALKNQTSRTVRFAQPFPNF